MLVKMLARLPLHRKKTSHAVVFKLDLDTNGLQGPWPLDKEACASPKTMLLLVGSRSRMEHASREATKAPSSDISGYRRSSVCGDRLALVKTSWTESPKASLVLCGRWIYAIFPEPQTLNPMYIYIYICIYTYSP